MGEFDKIKSDYQGIDDTCYASYNEESCYQVVKNLGENSDYNTEDKTYCSSDDGPCGRAYIHSLASLS